MVSKYFTSQSLFLCALITYATSVTALEFSSPLLTNLHHSGTVWYADINHNSSLVLTCSSDKTARLWRADDVIARGDQAMPLAILQHDELVSHCIFSHDGSLILTSSDDQTSKIWRTRQLTALTGAPVEPLATLTHPYAIVQAIFSHDDSLVLTSTFNLDSRLTNKNEAFSKLWDVSALKNGTGQVTLLADIYHEKDVTHAVFLPDDSLIITSSCDNTTRSWDVASMKGLEGGRASAVAVIRHNASALYSATNLNASLVMTCNADHKAEIWDINVFKNQTDNRFLPSQAGSGHIDTTERPQPLAVLTHDGQVTRCAFSPDGTKALTVSRDTTARLWDISGLKSTLTGKHGASLLAILPHSQYLNTGAFSHDGALVLTGSEDGTAKLWPVADLEQQAGMQATALRVFEHEGGVWYGTFNEDSSIILTCSTARGTSGFGKFWLDVQSSGIKQALLKSRTVSQTLHDCVSELNAIESALYGAGTELATGRIEQPQVPSQNTLQETRLNLNATQPQLSDIKAGVVDSGEKPEEQVSALHDVISENQPRENSHYYTGDELANDGKSVMSSQSLITLLTLLTTTVFGLTK